MCEGREVATVISNRKTGIKCVLKISDVQIQFVYHRTVIKLFKHGFSNKCFEFPTLIYSIYYLLMKTVFFYAVLKDIWEIFEF